MFVTGTHLAIFAPPDVFQKNTSKGDCAFFVFIVFFIFYFLQGGLFWGEIWRNKTTKENFIMEILKYNKYEVQKVKE